MAKCNDPKKDCPLMNAGECTSKLPGYCCYYDIPVVVKEAPKVVKAAPKYTEEALLEWANQGFETRIAALT